MNIWIDLANSPHVLFFNPIIERLKQNGHMVNITMRDFAQTISLAKLYQLDCTAVGQHGGSNKISKGLNLLNRSLKLRNYVKEMKADLAFGHGSYELVLAGKLAGIKVFTAMDYEFQPANHFAFRLSDYVIVPKCFPDEMLKKFGASPRKIYKYDGFKEQLYLSRFVPDKSFYNKIIDACSLNQDWKLDNNVLVVIRPPATMALYHNFSNPLFDNLVSRLNSHKNLTVILLPRTQEQKELFIKNYPNLHIPTKPLDGPNLLYYADMVISAGGTINREAAILGTPVYTIFAGQIPAVDKYLMTMNRLRSINDLSDIGKLIFDKKKGGEQLKNPDLLDNIIEFISTKRG